VANTSISKFAALNYSTGVPLSWRPVFNGSVYSLINFDDRIVVAGAFTKINNLSRNYMAAFDSDGQLMDFAPDINSAIFAMDHDKGKLYLGGFFTEVNGISRNRIACIDTSGSLTNFNPDVDNAILALKFFKDKIYIGGWFDFVSGQSRTKFACINKNGYLTSFAPNPNNAVWSIMTFSVPFDVIYIGGDFTSIFGQSLSNLAAIDANGGLVPWYPNPDKSVFALSSSGSQVYAGGLFLSFENTLSPNFAILSTYSLNPGKPTLISPVNNSLKIPVLSRFDWNATEYTSNYRIQFSTNIQFNAIVYDTIVDINYLQFAESKLLYNTKMYWRVRSINLQGISQWSDTWSFTTRVAPPPAPILVSPSDASIGIGLSDIFKWNLSTTAESYQIQFSSDEFFNSIILNDSSVADTQRAIFDLAVEPLQSYYWRTRAINESGPGMWSQEWNFTTAEFFAQNINLKVGWNLISSNLIPLNDTVSVIFHNIDDKILIVKNGGGAVYIPQYQINTIGKWKDKDSYNVYCTSASTLTILGYRLNPDIVNYNLVTGWNLISYIRSSDMGVEVALKSLTDDNKLLIAKDGNGNVFIPDYGINTIGNMKTGLGYNLYIKSPITFTYPAND